MCYGSGCKYERWDGSCSSRSRGCYMDYIDRLHEELEENCVYIKDTIKRENIKCKHNIGDEDCSNGGLCCYGCDKVCDNRCDKYEIDNIKSVDTIVNDILYCKNNNKLITKGGNHGQQTSCK